MITYEQRIINEVRKPPVDGSCEQEHGNGFNVGYDRGHGQAKVDARQIARGADEEIQNLNDRINQLENDLNEMVRKYNEAIYVIWLLDTHEEAKDLLKKHDLWGKSVQKDSPR